VAVAGLSGAQGLGVVLAGLGAELFRPSTVVALTGGLGLLAISGPLGALLGGHRPRHAAVRPPVISAAVPEGRSGA
jgi:hypothetical protein